MRNIVIAGSRSLQNNYKAISVLDTFFKKYKPSEFTAVSGMARGIDIMARDKAIENGFTVLEYPADWERYGKSAGYIRNAEMTKISHCSLILWDGVSRGTKHMIDLCEKEGVATHLIVIR